MMVELKPCPFCGQSGPTEISYCPDHSGHNFAVRCICGAAMQFGDEESTRITWNTRPNQSAQIAEHVRAFAEKILHGDDNHRQWLRDAAEAYINGDPMPEPRGGGRKEVLIAELRSAAEALITRTDFWDNPVIVNVGIPGEYDDLLDALAKARES